MPCIRCFSSKFPASTGRIHPPPMRIFTHIKEHKILSAFILLLLLIAAFYLEENWRGKRAWEKYRTEMEAKGERFELRELIPKNIPPEQNMGMHPLLAPLFDYKKIP